MVLCLIIYTRLKDNNSLTCELFFDYLPNLSKTLYYYIYYYTPIFIIIDSILSKFPIEHTLIVILSF